MDRLKLYTVKFVFHYLYSCIYMGIFRHIFIFNKSIVGAATYLYLGVVVGQVKRSLSKLLQTYLALQSGDWRGFDSDLGNHDAISDTMEFGRIQSKTNLGTCRDMKGTAGIRTGLLFFGRAGSICPGEKQEANRVSCRTVIVHKVRDLIRSGRHQKLPEPWLHQGCPELPWHPPASPARLGLWALPGSETWWVPAMSPGQGKASSEEESLSCVSVTLSTSSASLPPSPVQVHLNTVFSDSFLWSWKLNQHA